MENKRSYSKELSLREIQLTELKILSVFSDFCNEHGLIYSLVGGTLLGAVRHKGFIPWDDDIDVGMPRPDYEKFIELIEANGDLLNENIKVITDRGKNAILPYLKIVDKRIEISPKCNEKSNNIWIDVFPYDGCPENTQKAHKLLRKAKHYRHIIVYNQFKSFQFKGFSKLVYFVCAAYAKMYGLKRAIKNITKLAKKIPYDKSSRVACVVWGLYGDGEIIDKESFDVIKLEFEKESFSVMKNWDNYLSGIYGDYMTIPPVDRRKSHHVIAYNATDQEGVNQI